MLTVLES